MKKVSIILTLILLIIVVYYVIQLTDNDENNKEPLYANELKEYSDNVKQLIIDKHYAFNSTSVDTDWVNNNLESNIKCKEIYYFNEEVLLHECKINDTTLYYYNKIYEKLNDEYLEEYEKIKNEKVEIEKGKLLSDIVTIDLELGIDSIDECTKNGICDIGTPLAIQVGDNLIYKFYVISDDGEKVKLLMDKNLINMIEWAESINSEGPVVALNQLNENTKNWNNISLRNYKISDGNKSYNDFFVESRAILPSYSDINTIMKNELVKSDNNGYWLINGDSNKSFNAYIINNKGELKSVDISVNDYGIRPVISVYKY